VGGWETTRPAVLLMTVKKSRKDLIKTLEDVKDVLEKKIKEIK